jgi:hypothetical protein
VNKFTNELNRQFSKEEVQMANKHMKKCLKYLAIKEMQVKNDVLFYLPPVRIVINKTNNKKC